MKYFHLISSGGLILVIIAALMKIFHYELVNTTALLIFGFALSNAGQTFKIKLLEKKLKEQGATQV